MVYNNCYQHYNQKKYDNNINNKIKFFIKTE